MKILVVLSVLIGCCSAYCPNSTVIPPWRTTRPPWKPTTRPPWIPTTKPRTPTNGSCNFDDRPCRGFLNQDYWNDDFDWTKMSGSTPSFNTGPSGDHTTGHGYYYYIEATRRNQGDLARLKAYVNTKYPSCYHFYYHMYGIDMGTLRIYVNGGLVWELSGNQGNQWIRGTFPINYAGYHTIKIEGIVGQSYMSDIALDDLGYQEFNWMSKYDCMVTPSCAKPSIKPPLPTTYPPWTTPRRTYPPWTTPYWTNPPISNVSCGQSTFFPHQRVIGGQDALPGSWPWQVGLYVFGSYFICGGSLVSPEWVVTAAHCIIPQFKNMYSVVLGDVVRNASEGTEQKIQVSKIIVHPLWNNKTIDSDIALIKLSQPASFNWYVKPVCLPWQDEYVPTSSRCYITGWGKIRHPGNSHYKLQEALLPRVSNFQCQLKLSASNASSAGLTITNNMICGGEQGSIKGGCHGDSGGPYVCQGSNGRWVLQGAVSWGSSTCNAQSLYTVFARVAKFRNWIDTVMTRF